MSNPISDASTWIHNAIQLEKNGRYKESEQCYTQAILLLRNALADPSMPDTQKQSLMNYVSDVAKRVQNLRNLSSNNNSSPRPQQSPSPPPMNSGNSAARITATPPVMADSGSDYLDFLDLPGHSIGPDTKKTNAPTKGVSSPPPSSAPVPPSLPTEGKKDSADSLLNMPPVPKDFLAEPDLTPAPNSGAANKGSKSKDPGPPPAMSAKHGLNEYFAPRTSNLVLKAIDVATKLNKQGELKRAVDVLQHAYMTGRVERNNPANFKEIESTLELMRKRYYQKHPPRFLQDNPILPAEMEVLRKSGITSTLLLPLWDDLVEGYGAENVFMPCEDVWEDKFTPVLGPGQQRKRAQLLHVEQLARPGHSFTIIRQADPLNIKQTVVGDCTLVCSLIICASYQKRYPNAKIISNVIYPQDLGGNPIVNPKGKYCVKMLINGMTRVVTIDDRLPANPSTKELLCTYSRDPTELWVSLMEKAFVKICGGSYDFPGSSSSTDLYKLSGWLPDSVLFTDSSFDGEFEWNRIARTFSKGAVLMTITTGTQSKELDAKLEKVLLSSQHCYAVTDVREINGKRVLVVQNPWSKPTWSGELSHKDTSPEAVKIQEECGVTGNLVERGVFCISWEDVLKYYDRCLLSWNPYLLFPTPEGHSRRPTRLACHGVFDYTTSVGQMPQMHIGVVKAPKRTRMHLVFSRHISDVREFGLSSDKEDKKIPYVAIKVYDVSEYPSIAQNIGGKCVFGMCYSRRLASASDLSVRMQPLNSVTYRKNSAWTTSFDCPPGNTDLLVVVTRLESSIHEPFSYTVTLHTELEQMTIAQSLPSKFSPESMECINFDKGNKDAGVYMHSIPKTCLKHTSSIQGKWEKGKSCGGRSDVNTFVYNPQYLLTLRKPAMISARLCVPESEETCQLHLVLKKAATDRVKAAGIPFINRVGNTSSDCTFVMRSKVYSYGGALVDSALPHTLDYDGNRIIGGKRVDEAKRAQVKLLSADPKRTGNFTIYDVDDTDEMSIVLLAAVNKGHLVSPVHSKVIAAGTNLPQGVMGWGRIIGKRSALGDALVTADKSSFEVEISLETDRVSFPAKSPGEELWENAKKLCGDIRACSSQMSSYVSQIINLHRRARQLNAPEQTTYLTDLCMFLAEYVKRVANENRPPPQPVPCLPPLPAGEYTLIPSLWEKGVPANFELMVETTESHTLVPIPDEGSGWQSATVNGQLLKTGGSLSSTKAPTNLGKENSVFQNSKVSVNLSGKGLLSCRLFVVGGDEEADNKKCYVNVSVFVERDQAAMEMIASSGSYTSAGCGTAPVAVEKPALIVISASPPTDKRYVLRLFSDTGIKAALTM